MTKRYRPNRAVTVCMFLAIAAGRNNTRRRMKKRLMDRPACLGAFGTFE